MNIEKLNKIFKEFSKDESSDFVFYKMDDIIVNSMDVLSKGEFILENDNYSVNFSVNESIKIISEFLGTIDESLKEQFENSITFVDEKGEPIINFVNGNPDYYKNHDEELTPEIVELINKGSRYSILDNKVYIILKNTQDDIYVIIHELFHYMNTTRLYTKNSKNNIFITVQDFIKYNFCKNIEFNSDDYCISDTYTRIYYGEVVSIVMEKLLAQYMLQRGLITENDYKLKYNKRLQSSKKSARGIIVYAKLLEEVVINNAVIDEYKFKEISEELKCIPEFKYIINGILKGDEIKIINKLRYVTAEKLLDRYNYNVDEVCDILLLNDKLTNIHSDFKKLCNEMAC